MTDDTPQYSCSNNEHPRARLPAAFPAAEEAVISAIMLKPELIDQVLPVLPTQAFFLWKNQRIYRAIQKVGYGQDIVTVARYLQAQGDLDAIGGTQYLAQVVDGTPAIMNVMEHVKIVRDCYLARVADEALTLARHEIRTNMCIGDSLSKMGAKIKHVKKRLGEMPSEKAKP